MEIGFDDNENLLDAILDDIDLATDDEHLESLNQSCCDLDELTAQIAADGGISQLVAMAINEANAELLPESTPIASFTQAPSNTNLIITLEAIADYKNWILGGIVLAAAALIAKIAHWVYQRLFGGSSRSGSSGSGSVSSAAEVIEKHDEAAAAAEEIAPAVEEVTLAITDLAPELKREVEQAKAKAVEEAQQSLIDGRNDLIWDLTNGGPYKEALQICGKQFILVCRTIQSKLELYLKLFDDEESERTTDDFKTAKQLETIIAPIHSKAIGSSVDELKMPDLKDVTSFAMAISAMKIHAQQLLSTSKHPALDLDALTKARERRPEWFRVDVEDTYLKDPKRAAGEMLALEKLASELKKRVEAGGRVISADGEKAVIKPMIYGSERLANDYKAALAQIQREISCLATLTALFFQAMKVVNGVNYTCYRADSKALASMVTIAEATGDKEMIAHVRELVANAKR